MKRRYVAAAVLGIGACLAWASRPPALRQDDQPRVPAPSVPSPLADAARREARGRGNRSGLHLLPDPHDAFAARMLLVRGATRTLDLRYYIWHGDRTGTLLLSAVLDAADRGVRVRLLLDDNGIPGLDRVLSALDRHPMISVRIFNPFAIRFPKALGFVLDFPRLNRRMHNKSLTADEAVTIVGGRNIGDEYFGSGTGGTFDDLDVLAVGRVVADVGADFERYWCCGSAYPARQVLPVARGGALRKLRRAAWRVRREPEGADYLRHVRDLPILAQLRDGTLPLDWAPVRLISDDPAKGLGQAGEDGLLAGQLSEAVGRPRRKLDLISGYFVPGPRGTRQLAAMARHGVEVRILTNSFEAADVPLVHAGYAPSRHALLRAGVRLFEMKAHRDPGASSRSGTRVGVGSRLRGTGTGSTATLRAGATTLHAKTMTVDDRTLFVGSFNLDPRSWQLNCEMGFVIDSPRLAREVSETFETYVPDCAYELRLGQGIEWVEPGAGRRILRAEPGMGLAARMVMALAQCLPIRWLL